MDAEQTLIEDTQKEATKNTRFLIRVPENIMNEVKDLSETERRSTNAQILYMLEQFLLSNTKNTNRS